jgi:GH25 family lysozyme M1 (1,4-beta-N-acetylmuramidase)
MAKYIRGIDVAHWEPEIDWAKVRAQEIRFAFIKATQAADYVDDRFLPHWREAKQAGILRGAYHFIDPRVDGRLQAEHFLRTVKLEPGDLPPVLDLEDLPVTATVVPKAAAGRKSGKDNKGNKGAKPGKGATAALAANSQMIACAEVWLRLVEQETGRKPIVYSGPFFLRDRMADARGAPPSWASKYMLWIANYLNHPVGDNDLPLQPKGWAPWTFWQYSESGMLNGVYNTGRLSLTAVDLNFFRGTLEELYSLAGATIPAGGAVEQPKVEVSIPKVEEKVGTVPVNVTPEPAVVTGLMTYCIESGATLFRLAMRFHTTVEAILEANPQITNPDFIRAGDNLNIPQAG